MARARRRLPLPTVLLVLAAIAVPAWFLLRDRWHGWPSAKAPAGPAATVVADDRVDPANEGHPVRVAGTLRVASPARDAQLGIEADAPALLRTVEMLQWQETCAAASCGYALAWSDRRIDSHAFREAQGHANTTPFPLSSERFLSGDVRLGAFKVDAALATDGAASTAWPVRVAQLRPNLAATFRDCDGALCTGADPARPAVGDLRVRYRVVAAGARTLGGVQHGDHLDAPPAR